MTDYKPSKTALGVAVLRAVHQRIDSTPKILDDPVSAQLIDSSVISQIPVDPSRFQTPQSIGLRAHVVLRSRYAEDRLAKAVERGIRQHISLGAGLDTFAYRQPTWAHTLRIFEVDQPASQGDKCDRLQKAGIEIPPNVEFVPIDFETTSLSEGLQKSSFDPSAPTFISWLGVMIYLSQDAIDAVMKFAASRPHHSEIVFTFSQPHNEQDQSGFAESAAKVGEPWKAYITSDDLIEYLRRLGFTEITIPAPAEIEAWYIRNREDGLRTPQRSTIASAII